MFDSGRWDEGLDEAQLAVAMHGEAPLVVVAGAGTGKTRALVARLARLLECGTPPERILLLTFTRRAADDMVARAAALGRISAARGPHGGTFHAEARRHLSTHAESIGLPADFGILDPADSADLLDLLREDQGLSGTAQRFPRSVTLAEIYSRCVNTARPLYQVVTSEYPWCEPHLETISGLFRAFTARKKETHVVDFDDLLLYWRALLQQQAELSDTRIYDFVLVDEYQDVNAIQVDIVKLLAPGGCGLTVVGDEAQAIYGFRGAESRHLRESILGLPAASLIRFERNFRSRQPILDVANAIRSSDDGPTVQLAAIRGGGSRPSLLRCHDANEEARAVVDNILAAHETDIPLRQQAVLVRAGHHSDLIELELSARHVPYRKYGGLRFIESSHVKDFLAAARLLDSPHDEIAWYRLLRLHQGIGPSRARELVSIVRNQHADPLEHWPELVAAAPTQARLSMSHSLPALAVARAHESSRTRAGAVLDAIRPVLEEHYSRSAPRISDLERLVSAAGEAKRLSDWISELLIDPPISSSDFAGPPTLDEDYVVISTIHSAKGLEWEVVHVPHLVDGALPIDMALGSPKGLAEERRLFYVAVTRARDQLWLYCPLRLHHRRRASDDRHSYAQSSRFVDQEMLRILNVEQRVPKRHSPQPTHAAPLIVDLDPLWSSGPREIAN